MATSLSDRFPAALVLFGALLLICGNASADPGGDPCSTKCQHEDLIITSPKLTCALFDDPICTFCNEGEPNSRCVDFVGPGQPFCKKTGTTKVRGYPDGSCKPKCTLPLNGTSQSTQGLPPLGIAADFDLTQCSTTPP